MNPTTGDTTNEEAEELLFNTAKELPITRKFFCAKAQYEYLGIKYIGGRT